MQLFFSGRDEAGRQKDLVKPRVLHHIPALSVLPEGQDASECLLIEGDNLQSMKSLYRLRGRVDLIVTDPPYNVGKDFRYNDRWEEDPNDSSRGSFVSGDDLGRHTKWCRFMWPRILMMHEMLASTGVLAICIGQQELFRLGQLLDERFGEGNRLAVINWQTAYSAKSDAGHVGRSTEYVLVYAKSKERATTGLMERTTNMDARYRSPDGDPRPWKSGDLSAPGAKTHPGMVYAIQSPFTGKLFYPPEGCCWRIDKKAMRGHLEEWGSRYVERDVEDGLRQALVLADPAEASSPRAEEVMTRGTWPPIYFGQTGRTGPQHKRYLDEVQQGKVPDTYWAREDLTDPALELDSTSWDHEQSGHSQDATKALRAIVGAESVDGMVGVKPLRLIRKLIQIWCPPGGLVLDPFAGSGTTGDAILRLNKEHEGVEDYEPLRFALIERGAPEKGDEYAQSLTRERLARVITGEWADERACEKAGGATGGELMYLRLDEKGPVDAQAILASNRADLIEMIVSTHIGERNVEHLGGFEDYDYLVGRNKRGEGIYLIWSGAEDAAQASILTKDTYNAIAAECRRAGLTDTHHVYACLWAYQTNNVVFHQIPNQILESFGLGDESGGT